MHVEHGGEWRGGVKSEKRRVGMGCMRAIVGECRWEAYRKT